MRLRDHAARSSVILSVGLIACSAIIPRIKIEEMKVFSETTLEYSASTRVRVHLIKEIDYAEYFSVIGRYDLPTIRHELQLFLSQENITISGPFNSRGRLTKSLSNPFTLSEMADADLELQIVVDVFDYGDKRTLGGKIIRFALLGGIGLLSTGEQALCIVSYKITDTRTHRLVNEGTIHALSGEGYVPRIAFESSRADAGRRLHHR